MTTEEAQKVLDELNEIKVEELSGNSKRLFEAIMKIADEKDELYKKVKELGKGQQTLIQSRRKWKNRYYKMKRKLKEKNKTIDLMAEAISSMDTDIKVIKKQTKEEYCDFLKSDAEYCWKTDVECRDCIKQYFENKAKEYLKER